MGDLEDGEITQTRRLVSEVLQKETHRRLQAAVELFNFFENEDNSVNDFEDIEKLIEGLAGWTNSGNPKICANGMDLMLIVIKLLGERFQPYISAVLPVLGERLGDQRAQVRSACLELLLDMMKVTGSVQPVLDQLIPFALPHKAWHIREQGLLLAARALDQFGTQLLLIGRHMASICKLTEDANFQVREQANSTLVTVYCHVGERIRGDLEKKGVPAARLGHLLARFDEVKAAGKVLVPDTSGMPAFGGPSKSGSSTPGPRPPRHSLPTYTASEASSVPDGAAVSRPKSRHSIAVPQRNAVSGRSASAASAGAVGEEDFKQAFEDRPAVGAMSVSSLEAELTKVEEILVNTDLNWETRATACKRLRSFLALNSELYASHLPALEAPLRTSIKDLRSSMMREACITVSFMAQELGGRIEHFCEAVLPALFNLLPNSAKVMASSAHTCVSFLMQHVHSGRFIPLFVAQYTAKSPLTRRRILEFVGSMLQSWPVPVLERHVTALKDVIHKAIHDADSATRTEARNAFWGLSDSFPAQAERLRSTLDASKQRLLDEQKAILNGETPVQAAKAQKPRKRFSQMNRRFTSEPDLSPMADRRSIGLVQSNAGTVPADVSLGTAHSSWSISMMPVTTAGETTSASSSSTNSANARRSIPSSIPAPPKLAASASLAQRPGRGGKASLGAPLRPPKSAGTKLPSAPASNLSQRPATGIGAPASVAGSSAVGSGQPGGPEELQPLQDLINSFDSSSLPLNKSPRHNRDEDAASQGSVASYGSRGSLGSRGSRGSSSSAGMSSSHAGASRANITLDVPEIQRLCASGVWQERRDGLASLEAVMKSERVLSVYETSKFTELFYRMFRDPHNTVVRLLLDVLKMFVNHYHNDLAGWLPTLLQRCFHRCGPDVRSSIRIKLHTLLCDIREKFAVRTQLDICFQLLEEQSTSVTPAYKEAILLYIKELIPTADPGDFCNCPEHMQGLSTVIAHSQDSSSADMRRTATKVVASLFELNTATFTTMLSLLPRSHQDHAHKVMEGNLQNTVDGSSVVPDAAHVPVNGSERPYNPGAYQDVATPPCSGRRSRPSSGKISANLKALSKSTGNLASPKLSTKMSPVVAPSYPDTSKLSLSSTSRQGSNGEFSVLDNLNQASNGALPISDRVAGLANISSLSISHARVPLSSTLLALKNEVVRCISALLRDPQVEVRWAALKLYEELFRPAVGGHRTPPVQWFTTEADIMTCFGSLVECLGATEDKRFAREMFMLLPLMVDHVPVDQFYAVLMKCTTNIVYPQVHWHLKFLALVCSRLPTAVLMSDLATLVPRIVQCYNHKEGVVRHAAVNCLVELEAAVGKEALSSHLTLTSAQAKLLELYVRRQAKAKAAKQASEDNGRSAATL